MAEGASVCGEFGLLVGREVGEVGGHVGGSEKLGIATGPRNSA